MLESEISDQNRWMALHSKIFELRIKEAFNFYRENDIEPILIKGWAIAQYYPEYNPRVYTDIDICVSPEKYPLSLELLKTEFGQKLKIDLHCGLRHLDTVKWDNLFRNSRLTIIDKIPIRILRPEDHLRVLCVHWLTDGGAYKDKLFDIYYAVRNRPIEFDWSRCLDIVNENRRNWIIKTIGLAHKYCGLDISDLFFADEAKNIPKWMTEALEKEWTSKTRLKPLHLQLKDRKELWLQIKKESLQMLYNQLWKWKVDSTKAHVGYIKLGVCFIERSHQ